MMRAPRQTVAACAVCCALVLLVTSAGCNTAPRKGGQTRSFTVVVLSSGSITVDGRVVSGKDLARTLKRKGATRADDIIVEIPGNAAEGTMKMLWRNLAGHGLNRVVFAKPRVATATTE